MTQETITLIRELRGNKCLCGRDKPSGKTFCYLCYHELPDTLKRAIYKRVGQGYEEAYVSCVAVLKGTDPKGENL